MPCRQLAIRHAPGDTKWCHPVGSTLLGQRLELQLGTTSVGASRGVGGVDVLEDDAFGPGEAEVLVGLDLGVGIDRGAAAVVGAAGGCAAEEYLL